jgi:hypothetical protein
MEANIQAAILYCVRQADEFSGLLDPSFDCIPDENP